MSCKPRTLNKFFSFLSVSLGGSLSFAAMCTYRGDETFYSNLLMPFVSKYIDPELAHNACINLTRLGLIKCRDIAMNQDQAEKLKVKMFDRTFSNPIGLAAGFDKSSDAVSGLANYGFGFVEIGTVTPLAQDGNPKKRIFRAPEDGAIVNRCGFNNKGMEYVRDNLSKYDSFRPMIVGLNIGKNKTTEDISSDYVKNLEQIKDLKVVDYIVINISSPNTPGLRDIQEKKNLDRLLNDVLSKMNELNIDKPLLVKIAPDISQSQMRDIADLVVGKRCGTKKVNGIILTNTTISRPTSATGLTKDIYTETGGLSGPPLRDLSNKVISDFYKYTKGKIPIIGVGGVSNGQDAYDKIKAGASLVQLYTRITYEGPPVVNKIKRELLDLLERDNLGSISEAVGTAK